MSDSINFNYTARNTGISARSGEFHLDGGIYILFLYTVA